MGEAVDDGPESDGCGIDFGDHADDEETQALRPLFPDGDPSKAAEWHALSAAGLLGPS